ncbi:hypothetical protein G6F24_017537 [Rhizopus arrhizus]|nr:hypothetical protein G6F24_017537 [Rhizopus arrhizus]
MMARTRRLRRTTAYQATASRCSAIRPMMTHSLSLCQDVSSPEVASLTCPNSGPCVMMSSVVNRPLAAWKPMTSSRASTDSAPSGLWPAGAAAPFRYRATAAGPRTNWLKRA